MSVLDDYLKGRKQNNGSGAKYLLGKATEGLVGSVTGTLTTVAGGLNKLFGNDEEAERYVRMFSGVTGEADYRFNPDDSWKMAGDTAQGIGNSLPMMAVGVAGGAAIGSAIGAAGLTGTAAKIASVAGNKLVTFTSSFLSATGSGVQEAYQKTGKVDDKAWKSGVASGVIEGGTEALLDLGVGGVTSQAINLGSKIAGTAATAAVKRFSSKIGVQIAKDLAGSFVSEALEEGISAILSPIANNIIYQDEIARGEMEKETLDWHDIGYQMLVGGLSGVIMGGANTIVSESVSTARGAEAIRSGKVDQIMQSAQEILNAYSGDETMTKTEAYKRLQNALQNAEKAKGGLAAARYVAEAQEASAAVALSDQVVTSARQILTNPEAVATRINQFALKDTEGHTIRVTAAEIRNSVKNGNLAEALTEDGNILRKLAVLDAAGRMYADTQAYESAVERGEYLGDRADVAHFLQTASTEEVQAVNNALGLDIATASYDDIREAFVNKSVNAAFGGQQEARQGGQASLTAQEAQNSAQERTNGAEQSAGTTAEAENATETKKRAAQARADTEKTLSENVSQWERMPSRNRTLVRQTYTQAVNNGYSAEEALTFARLSAKAGINIEFTENGMQTASGDTVDGYYDRGENVIVFNPKSKKPFESLLIHELTHSLEKTTRYGRVMDQSLKSLSETERNRIIALYQPVTQGKSAAEKVEILSSEYTAHYTEKALKSKKFLEALVKEDRTIADRIRAFFEQRFGDEKLDRNARKLAKAYEKAFSEMAQRNFGANAVSVENVLSPSVPQYNLSAVETHRKNLAEKIEKKSALTAVELDEEYMKSVRLWERVTKKLNSRFLDDWNAKTVRTREFTVLKEQQGYPYNEELATSCVKAVPLFEAIDKIVSDGTVDQLNVDVIGKSEKEILYKLLSEKGFQIPCAICYVEQARQREGVIINAFINGEESRGKLGWNSVIASISDKMRQMGKPYDFIVQDAALLKDSYDMSDIRMDEQTESAFIKATVDLCNEEIGRENAKRKESFEKGKSKKYNPYSEIKGYSASAIKNALKGSLSENLGIFQTLLLEPNSRFKIGKSTLYSTIATKNLAAFHHRLYALFNKQAGTAGYKTKQLPVIYWGDVLARKWKPSDLRKKGGMRSQSNSDYQMYTFLDVMQLYADLTAKGYTAHEYTKVLSLVKLFGLSGVKINTSLIPRVVVYRNSDGTVDVAKTQEYAGLAEDGKTPIYDDVEGINHEEAFSIISDAEYSKSVGGICIGYSDRHIAALLDDPRVQLIIGYHDKTDNPDKRYAKARYAHNYNGENEVKTETGKTKHIAFNTYVMEAEKLFKRSKDGRSFTGTAQYMGNTYNANDIPKLAAKMYLDYCEVNGYTPAYPQFVSHKNYYKLLADFNLYDSRGNYAPQNSVRLRIPSTVPIRNTDGTVSRMNTEDYIVKELRSEMQMRDDLAEALADKSADGIIPQFVKRVNERSESNIAAPQGGRQLSISAAPNTDITTDVNGRRAQFVANNTRREQYTVRDAREVVSDIIAEMRFGDENETVQAKLSGKDRNAVVAYLFDRLNSVPAGNRAGVALKIADYIVENAVLEEVFDSVRTEQIDEAKNVVSSILRYKNKFNLSAIRSDIKSVYDTKAAAKTMLWGGGNMTADKIAMELADDGINIQAVNEAEIFTEIMDAYDRAKSVLAERANTYKLEQYGTEEEVQAEKQRIAKEILAAYEERGKETTFARLTDKYTRRISELRDALRESYSYNRLANRLTAQAQQIADWKKGVFSNATQIRGDAALSMVGELGKISFRGNVNHARTRQIVGELYQWYQENAKELGSRYNLQVAEMMNEIASAQKYMTDEESRAVDNAIELYQHKGNSIASFNSTELLRTLAKWYNKKNTGKNYNPGTAYLLKRLANATMLTAQEMQTMSNILAYFKKFVEGYNKAFIRGKRVDAGRSANLYILEAQNAAARTRKQNGKRVHKYEQAFFDPMSVAREADGYQKGFFTDILTDIRNGTVNAEITRMNVRRGLEEFYSKHKKFLTNADNEMVKYNGQDITKREAMQVYMTLQRKQAQAGMTINGFQIVRQKGEILRVNGVLSPLDFHSDEDITAEANRLAEELKKQFSADDLAYIELAEKAYLECRELKKKADIDRLGFSNVENGYYVPIKIANKGESIDADYFGEGNSVNNQSFNKSTVRHKHELLIQPIDQVLETHIRGIAQYNALHRAFDAFDILFNIDTRENPNKVKSIRTETARTWEGAFSYFAKLRDDITGKNQPIDGFNAAVSFLRGGYAKAALGLNPKVLATQLSSVFASTSILDYNDIARSANMKTDKSELYKYCPLAEVRNLENTAFKAAGVVDKVGGVGDALMKPIGTVDAFVISRLWNACQVSVERRSDLKIGTEANKVEAGKLLKQVILETQQNATATDRSGAMRSHSELARAITMFTADAMKVFNRVVDSAGSVLTVQSLIRDANSGNTQTAYDLLEAQIRAEAEEQASAETDDAEKIREAGEKAVEEKLEQAKADYLPNLQKEYKTAKRKLRKAIGALLSSSAYMAIIGFLFRKLYRKKDEEPADTLLDFTANLVNGMPIMKEIAAFALQGYDISVPSFEVINGMMNTAKSVFNAVGSGDGEKILKSFKNLLISAGQLTGLPVRNAINIFNAFRYEIVDIANGEPFSFRAGTTVAPADIAYEYYVAGKTKQQEIYMNKISDDKDKQNKAMQTRIIQLYGNGKLSRNDAIKQLQDFGLTKADAEWELDKDKYSDKNVSKSSYEKYKKIENSGISEDVYFEFVDKVSAFTSDKDKNGETISGSLRAKVLKEIRKLKLTTDQKLLILASRGYTAKDGDFGGLTAEAAQKRLLAYVRRVTSGMSKEEKKEFAKMFDMKVKNNLIFL